MDKRLIMAGGVLAVAAVIAANETIHMDEHAAALAEFRMEPAAEIAARKPGEEIRSLRTANSETYRVEDAIVPIPGERVAVNDSEFVRRPSTESRAVPQFTMRVYASPKYFTDPDADTLRALDLTAHDISALAALNPFRTHDKYVDAGPYTAQWMNDTPADYRIDAGEAYVKYHALFEGIETSVVPGAEGMKETLTLADEKAPALRWIVETDGGLVAQSDGSFIVRAKDGSNPLRIGAPRAWDAAGKPVMATASIEGDTLSFRVTVLPGQEYPVTVDPSTTVNAGSSRSGWMVNSSFVNYVTGRDGTTGSATAGAYAWVGADSTTGGQFNIFRSFFSFPIGMPGIVAASACTLYVYGAYDGSTTDFGIHLKGARSYRSVLENADFPRFNGHTASGEYDTTKVLNATWHSSSYLNAAWNRIVFNQAGLDSLTAAKGDTLWIAMLSNRDEAGTACHGEEKIEFYSASSPAYLSFTYTLPTINPPTNFQVTPIPGSNNTLSLSWSNNWSSSIDSLVLYRYPDSLRVATLTKTASSAYIGNLTPYAKFRYYIRADSAGIYGYSNPDSSWVCGTFKTENFPLSNYIGIGHLSGPNPDYPGIRGENNPDSLQNSIDMGQRKYGALYDINRFVANVALPAMMRVFAESLFIAASYDSSRTDFNIGVRSGLWSVSTAAKAKYTSFDGWQTGTTAYTGNPFVSGTFSTSGLTTGATLNKLPFTQAARDTTLKRKAAGDSLKFVMLSSKDISATAPTQAEFFGIDAASSCLRLTYAPPDSAPGLCTLTSISTDSLLVTWNDRSKSEYGYVLLDALTGNKVAGTDTIITAGARMELNGAFNDTTYWTSYGGRASIASIAGGLCGNCLQITQVSGVSYPGVYQNHTFIIGHTYRLDAFVKSGTSGDNAFYIAFYTANWNSLKAKTSGITSGDWTYYSITWTADITNPCIVMSKQTTTAGTMLFDVLTLKDITTDGDTYTRTLRVGGLSTNTEYAWKIRAVGGGADGLDSNADSCYTRAATPGKPTVSFPADSLLKFIVAPNGNPAYTEFAVQDSVSGKYVDPLSGVLDTLKSAAAWRTYAGWGGALGDTMRVQPGGFYVIRGKARNGHNQ
jgi:hypothetical protein